jgi:hypothetical protein
VILGLDEFDPGRAAEQLATVEPKAGWVLMPVPTAVPPMASSRKALMAFWPARRRALPPGRRSR